mmetsp:Transcript_32002/g.28364  ORF Transcript_32002/g.28364 Transcript_32002/m.28364 type:complete len:144 (-) Transcript_32002:32-463(-)
MKILIVQKEGVHKAQMSEKNNSLSVILEAVGPKLKTRRRSRGSKAYLPSGKSNVALHTPLRSYQDNINKSQASSYKKNKPVNMNYSSIMDNQGHYSRTSLRSKKSNNILRSQIPQLYNQKAQTNISDRGKMKRYQNIKIINQD